MRKTLAKFERKDPPPLLFMKGDEPYFRNLMVQSLKKHFRVGGYEVADVEGDSMNEDALLDILDQVSPGSPGKLVIVRNAEKIKDKKSKLAGYVADPTERVVVVFDASGECGSKLGEALTENAVVFESKPFKTFGNDIDSWLQDEAASYGKSLAPLQAAAIRSNIGTNLSALKYAVKKIALHADKKVICDDDLRAVIQKTASSQIYDFTSAFGMRDLKKAFGILDTFYQIEDDPSLILCSALCNSVERLIKAKSLLGYGLDRKDVPQILEMSPHWFEKNLEPQLKNYDLNTLVSALTALCEIDISLKSSGLDKRVLIENFLTRFLDREPKK